MECVVTTQRSKAKVRSGVRANIALKISAKTTIRFNGNVRAYASRVTTFGRTQEPQALQLQPLLFGADLTPPKIDRTLRISASFNLKINKTILGWGSDSSFTSFSHSSSTYNIPSSYDEEIHRDNPGLDFSFYALNENQTGFGGALLNNQKNGSIRAKTGAFAISASARMLSSFKITNTYTDKLGGHVRGIRGIDNFLATQKLYPIRDIEISKNGVSFVNKDLSNSGLYNSVDEGLFVGNYVQHGKQGYRISDDYGTFIQPSSIYSEGDFTYKCEITPPRVKPIENFLFIRAAAPMSVLESEIPPEYKIYNIRFEDPSGNLISRYKDIIVKGDSDYSREDEKYNFTTYISEPLYNNAKKYNWDKNIPLLNEPSGYTLSMDFSAKCFYKPFSKHFNLGYEDGCSLDLVEENDNNYMALDGSPLSTQSQGFNFTPNNSIRISNIEIVASGSLVGPLAENYANLFTKTREKGLMAERNIYPAKVLPSNFDTGINPKVDTVWKTYDIESNIYFNDNPEHLLQLNNVLNDLSRTRFIELHSIDGVSDSGKLQLKYEHNPPRRIKEQTGGSFSFGGRNRDSRLSTAKLEYVYGPDVFFEVDTIELHVRARKAEGGRNYLLDVVGYSDDRILNVTSAIGGFLQNEIKGIGSIPVSSGFNTSNYLTLSSETISSKEEYFYNDQYPNAGGDHYLLTQSPVVDSTEFKDYVIPLKIYKKENELGLPDNYTSSSNFESLYLDIYPLPSGAAIAKADLVVKYKPSNALTLHTVGYGLEETSRRYASLSVHPRKLRDNPINAIWTDKPLSLIESIPHGYETPATLKTNYARRWRGIDGSVKAGPFNAQEFDFSFYNPPFEFPFIDGYYDFNNIDENYIFSSLDNNSTDATGIYSQSLNNNLIKNIGLRFNSNKLFATQEREHTTIDWTLSGDLLHGHIMDSFDNAVRVQSENGNINFGNVSVSGGFSIYARFAPDQNVSGVDYNLFNSGIIVSKWDEAKDLELILGYKDGRLFGSVRDIEDNVVSVSDTSHYTEYQYPLSVIFTYNDNLSQKLKLYTDNELASGNYSVLRDTSNSFAMNSGDSNLIFGHSYGSGIGFNGFITEIGISTNNDLGSNIVSHNPNVSYQQITAERFFDGIRSKFWNNNESYQNDRYKMWSFVDEDTTKWYIGAFKYCEFGVGLDKMKKKIGNDYITHNFYTDGFTYESNCDLPLPSNVVTKDLAYHTQLENDMLRLNLGEVTDRFIAAAPRVVKDFPRGYDFATDAIAVDSIVEYSSTEDIRWPDGNIGPRLVVSLYTMNKESDLFETRNYGLINRDIHYLPPDLCWQKINSRFTVKSVQDTETEPWANFVREQIVNESNHYRYSNDVNNMFVQYDLAYPSGNYSSKINIHSCHVRLEDALHLSDILYIDDFNLAVSGESVSREYLGLAFPDAFDYSSSPAVSGLVLYTSGVTPSALSSEVNLFSSGAYIINNGNNPLKLYMHNFGVEEIGPNEFNLHSVGGFDFSTSQGGQNFGAYLDNMPISNEEFFGALEASRGIRQTACILYLENDDRFIGPYAENSFTLYTELGGNICDNRINLSVKANYETAPAGTTVIRTRSRNASMSLTVKTDIPDNIEEESAILYVDGYDPNIISISGILPLHTININPINKGAGQLETFRWNGTSKGTSIKITDNYLLSLDTDDEIRGVVTMCYGDCDENGNCLEYQLYTHDTLWFDTQCVDGGVIRPINIYNNPNTIAFNEIVTGYDHNYYGARKFENLIPGGPYKITITAQTGAGGILEVPKEITEWEYGTKNESTGNPEENIDYSGVKIIAPEENRHPFDEYGYAIASHDDIVAISSPKYNLEENGYAINKAGSIFVYRREPEPSGTDWSNQPDKSPWILDTQLTLPNGFLRDYYHDRSVNIEVDTAGFIIKTQVVERQYYVGGNERELGYSLDIAKTDDREIIVAGAPGGKWERTFEDPDPQPVNIALFIFTDEFIPTFPWPRVFPSRYSAGSSDYREILPEIAGRDTVFKYFSDPPIKFNVKIIICEGVLGLNDIEVLNFSNDTYIPEPDFILKREIHRILNFNTIEEKRQQDNVIFEELKEIYHEAFPLDENSINNNIPIIAGFYVDDSVSYGTKALGSSVDGQIVGGALDRFISWFRQYAYDNGLTDNNGTPAYPFTSITVGEDEGWLNQSKENLKDATDLDKLRESRAFLLFSNDIGTFNTNLNEFNLAAPSGGSVYIFENMDYGWEIIQEIKSPTKSNNTHVDRFGHDVAISEDGRIIVVGSPYINEAVQIYEYNENYMSSFYDTFATWIRAKGDPSVDTTYGELYEARRIFNNLVSINIGRANFINSAKTVFEDLSPSGKFAFRNYYNNTTDSAGRLIPNQSRMPYKLIREISHSDIKPSHTWPWLFDQYIPTARLGYSVDTNEDGTVIVAGSPTDSIGAQDEGIAWYKPGYKAEHPLNWASNVNAGAVRILEGRNYYPHSSVAQYGVFGNLHRTLNINHDNNPFFNHFQSIYNSRGLNYIETEFIDPEIPQDAGTLFIITPEENALSEEVIKNIQDWLGLGDRNLVLVGNDPIWEESGAYAEGNEIINSLLRRLGSRMKLHPARNRYESLVDRDSGLYYNNLPTHRPEKITPTYIYSANLSGSGVADIRLEDENVFRMYNCNNPEKEDGILAGLGSILSGTRKKEYVELQSICNMPVKHEGDLRAEWIDECEAYPRGFVSYKINLGLVYGTHTVCDWGCACEDPPPPLPTINYEPIPILAASEAITKEYKIPAIPERTVTRQEFVRKELSSFSFNYSETADSGLAFIWSENSGNYTYLNTNDSRTVSNSLFFNPLEYNNKNPILQAKAELVEDSLETVGIVEPSFVWCAEEKYEDSNNSKVILFSSVATESRNFLFSGSDENIKLYMNLTDKTDRGQANIAQLGGWTDRASFRSGYQDSELRSLFERLGNTVSENVNPDTINLPGKNYDIIWIANVDNFPTDFQINQLKTWLTGEDKKLIITFGTTNTGYIKNIDDYVPSAELISKARTAEYICEKLNISMRPKFLPVENYYAGVVKTPRFLSRWERQDLDLEEDQPGDPFSVRINHLVNYISNGTRGSRSRITENFYFNDSYDASPIEINEGTPLLFSESPVLGNTTRLIGNAFVKSGVAKVVFPVKEKTSYRIFFTTTSETKQEKIPLGFIVCGANVDPRNYEPIQEGVDTFNINISINDEGRDLYGPLKLPSVVDVNEYRPVTNSNDFWPITNYIGREDTYYQDFTTPSGTEEIEVYVKCNLDNFENNKQETLFTQRLISISGAELPLTQKPVFIDVFRDVEEVIPAIPGKIATSQVVRNISTSSSKYCPIDFCEEYWGYDEVNGPYPPDIADGPVTVAQEVYHQRPFINGVNKSRITLISDASLIQGDTIKLEGSDTRINSQLYYFLTSLYPFTNFPQQNNGLQYLYLSKLVSPEKTSPAKLLVDSVNEGYANLFGEYNINQKNATRFSNKENLEDFSTNQWRSPSEPYYHNGPDYVVPRDAPPPGPSSVELSRSGQVDRFQSLVESMGIHPKFKVTINGKTYEDPNYGQGVPKFMQDYGYDYLETERIKHVISGYPGDLFGFKVKINNNKIYVGSPFSIFKGENITRWQDVIDNSPSGPIYNADLGYYGGAGSLYVYEKNFEGVGANNVNLPWSCTRKIRPDSLSVGEDSSVLSDMFGKTFDVKGDVLTISAPGHSDDAILVRTSGEFMRKEFGPQFTITGTELYDTGNPELNQDIIDSGNSVINQGSIFTYENRISDWGTKKQDWVLIQKLIPQGYNARTDEQEFFGKSISLHRARRKDSDYSLFVGSPLHQYGQSGIDSITTPSGGASYSYDAMLRRLPPSYSNPETNIEGRIFGDVVAVDPAQQYVYFDFKNGYEYDKLLYKESIVFANQFGEIFIEASGQDKNDKGYAVHRPFIRSIEGSYYHGKYLPEYLRLFIGGKPPESEGKMNLFTPESTDNVYNIMSLSSNGILGYGQNDDPLAIYSSGGYVSSVSNSGLGLFLASGVASGVTSMDMYVRGKFV